MITKMARNANTLIFLATRIPKEERGQAPYWQGLLAVVFLVGVGAFLAFLFSRPLKKAENAFDRESRDVVKTRFIKTDVRTETSTSSAVGRAIVGDFVVGSVGAMVGASTAKEKDKSESTFIVFYRDGSSIVKTVRDGSEYYELYMSRLER